MSNIEPTVYIVDDDENILESLNQLFETVSYNFKMFSSARQFLDFYDPSKPGVLVLDIRMPEMSGLGLQEKLAKYRDILPVIFITGHGDVSTATEAFKGGAVDFIEKPFSDQKLLDSINKAIETSLKNYSNQLKVTDIQERMNTLTHREREILEGVVDGKTNKMIAFELGISPKTVDFHRLNVMEKMGVNSVVQLTKIIMSTSGR